MAVILLTVGSQKFQFNRLLQCVDNYVEKGIITDEIYAQIGHSNYEPLHYEYARFVDRDEFSEKMRQAQVVIAHGGTGAIITALKAGKKVLAVPRLSKFGEHVDDHQIELVDRFSQLGYIEAVFDINDLPRAYDAALHKSYKKYVSNSERYVNDLRRYINSL